MCVSNYKYCKCFKYTTIALGVSSLGVLVQFPIVATIVSAPLVEAMVRVLAETGLQVTVDQYVLGS